MWQNDGACQLLSVVYYGKHNQHRFWFLNYSVGLRAKGQVWCYFFYSENSVHKNTKGNVFNYTHTYMSVKRQSHHVCESSTCSNTITINKFRANWNYKIYITKFLCKFSYQINKSHSPHHHEVSWSQTSQIQVTAIF